MLMVNPVQPAEADRPSLPAAENVFFNSTLTMSSPGSLPGVAMPLLPVGSLMNWLLSRFASPAMSSMRTGPVGAADAPRARTQVLTAARTRPGRSSRALIRVSDVGVRGVVASCSSSLREELLPGCR
jgi:hypothetical protein